MNTPRKEWAYVTMLRGLVAGMFTAAVLQATALLTGNMQVAVVTGLCGCIVGDYVAGGLLRQ